jgi:6-phosphofructokinase
LSRSAGFIFGAVRTSVSLGPIRRYPKTIDNDLDLPPYVDTFGFQTARHHGVEIIKYFVIAMGRKAGHLALGIDKSAGAIIKRMTSGRRDGVAVLAFGLILGIEPHDLELIDDVERDAHDNVRLAEVNIGELRKTAVAARLLDFGLKAAIVAKNIGYELRCADPIPADMEYTRDLGYCADRYVMAGGNAAMISMQAGRARILLVDIHSTRYRISRRYTLRLHRDDFEDPHELAKFAATAGISLDDFRREFAYLVQHEPPPLALDLQLGFVPTTT